MTKEERFNALNSVFEVISQFQIPISLAEEVTERAVKPLQSVMLCLQAEINEAIAKDSKK